jgi:hypothetical protein
LKAKVEKLAKVENFHKFDHLVRSLGRDGLLSSGVGEKLVEGGLVSIVTVLTPSRTDTSLH